MGNFVLSSFVHKLILKSMLVISHILLLELKVEGLSIDACSLQIPHAWSLFGFLCMCFANVCALSQRNFDLIDKRQYFMGEDWGWVLKLNNWYFMGRSLEIKNSSCRPKILAKSFPWGLNRRLEVSPGKWKFHISVFAVTISDLAN